MKKILLTIVILPVIAFSQVRIGGTTEPNGILDLNPDNGKTAVSGLVLPIVESADTINIAPDGQTPRYYPKVVTADATYSTQSVSETDDDGIQVTNYYYLPDPTQEAPAGTIVYDESTDGIRWKKSSKLGDWSENIADKTMIKDIVNYYMLGGTDFKVAKVSCGYRCSAIISASDGSVYTAGENAYYRTGKGNNSGSASWSKILDGPAIDVSMGYRHGIAVLSNGDVYVWGYNYYGKTGLGTASGYTMTPAKATLPNGEKALRCEADLYNSLVLAESGNVYSCGRNYQGRNGNGETSGNQTTFQKIDFKGVKIKDIKMSGYMCGALGEDGKIYVWGYGGNGRLGTGNSSNQSTPVMLDTPAGVKFKIFGISTTQGFAFTTDNKLYRWGYYNNRMLPHLVNSSASVKPTEVTFSNLDQGENVVCAATIKSYFGYLDNVECMMFATDHGRLFASGQNNSNKLGVVNDNNGNSLDPVNAFSEVQNHGIYAGTVFTNISIGPNHTLVSTSTNTEYPDDGDNVAYVCGTSSYKDFGDGRTTMVFTKLKK